MKPTETLKLLLEHAERERDAALAALQQAEAARRRAQGQAEQLAGYRSESLRRWGAEPGRTGSATMLQCVHGFVQRLDQASALQQRQCEHSAALVSQARQTLLNKELRVASVRKLIERRQRSSAALAERRDQKQIDEAAQRAAWAARAEAGLA